MKYFLNFTIIFVSLWLGGCENWTYVRGYNLEEDNLKKIQVNVDNQEKVTEILGSPSTVSCFAGKPNYPVTWYYISKTLNGGYVKKHKVLNSKVAIINFDDKGIVRSIKVQGLEQEQKINFSEEKTANSGYETGVLKEVFSDFGRNYGGSSGKKTTSR